MENALAGTDVLTQAIESIRMARQLYESQRGADALQSAQQAIVRYEILASDDETTRIDLARALQTHAEIAAGGGHRYAAIDGLQRAASIIDEQLAKEPTRVDYVQELMTIQSSLGDLYRATRQEQEAQRADEIVATIEKRLAETKTYRPIPSGGTNAASIFISYSHESSFHAERVRALADRLCREGLDVRLDQHLAHPKEGWPVWIERQIATADFVLLICTSTYRHRFEGTQALEPTPGTSFETRTAEQLLYESSTRNHGLIPMIPDDGTPDHIPTALRAFTYYRMSADFDVLRQRIVNNR
ncbi:MAG: TIR domain-containing protein [Myxococcota bacterium]